MRHGREQVIVEAAGCIDGGAVIEILRAFVADVQVVGDDRIPGHEHGGVREIQSAAQARLAGDVVMHLVVGDSGIQ